MANHSVPPTRKTCRTCGETKPVAAFPKNRRLCRGCRAAYMHGWKNGIRTGPLHTIINGTHKVCSKCGMLKPLDAYRMIKGKERRPDARRAECKSCATDYDHAYHAAHPEIRLTLWHAYYNARHEDMLARAQIYYYDNQKERMLYHRAWSKANPEKANAYTRKRKTTKRGLPSTFTHKEQAFCRQYFHYACAICNKEEGFQWVIALDHWIPLNSADCPGTIATNMIPLCHGMGGCNNSKKHYPPKQWLIRKFGKRKAAAILRKIEAYFAIARVRFP